MGITLLLDQLQVPGLFFGIGHLLDALVKGIGNIGWAIVLFTIIIKLITFPLDYWQRAVAKNNQLKMERMKPQLEKIKRQCGDDKQLFSMRQMELFKKEKYKVLGACLPMIISMVVFMLIFFAFNSYLKYNLITAYNTLEAQFAEWVAGGRIGGDAGWAEIAMTVQNEIQPSFLWIGNLWNPDVPWAQSALTSVDTFRQLTGVTGNIEVAEFSQMMAPFAAVSRANGYLILPILAALTSFASQFVMRKTQKSQMEAQGQANSPMMKVMMWLMPVIMVVFALINNAAFSIYIVIGAIYSFASTIVVNKIVEARFKKKLAKIENQRKESYMR